MLKKLLTISLAFLYLLVSSGLLVEIHHCMGRIADASLHVFAHEKEEGTCGKCGMPKTEEFALQYQKLLNYHLHLLQDF